MVAVRRIFPQYHTPFSQAAHKTLCSMLCIICTRYFINKGRSFQENQPDRVLHQKPISQTIGRGVFDCKDRVSEQALVLRLFAYRRRQLHYTGPAKQVIRLVH